MTLLRQFQNNVINRQEVERSAVNPSTYSHMANVVLDGLHDRYQHTDNDTASGVDGSGHRSPQT